MITTEELFAPVGSGIELCYQTFGDPADEPLLLIMGLGGPMTWWDPDLCRDLAEAGFYVIRYDNRDIGRSTLLEGVVGRSTLVRAFAGLHVPTPYAMSDLATDGFALLDQLDIDSAHVVGVSMGGMIAQTMAIARPDRVRSLTSIMSTTGKRTVGWQHPTLLPTMMADRAAGREAYVEASTKLWQLISSPTYPQTRAQVEKRAGDTFDRGIDRRGVTRQMLAVLTQPNRTLPLHDLRLPTLVIHGLSDKMVHVSGGRATAAAIPRSELLLIDGMGHDLPPALFETFVTAIARNAGRV